MYGYGDDELIRTEGPDEKESGDEDSRESISVSIPPQTSLSKLGFFLCFLCLPASESCKPGMDLQTRWRHLREILWLYVFFCIRAPAGNVCCVEKN